MANRTMPRAFYGSALRNSGAGRADQSFSVVKLRGEGQTHGST